MTDRKAQNWSRRDNIRAGSVSGPWRSTSRDDEVAAKVDEPAVVEPPITQLTDAPVKGAATVPQDAKEAMFPEQPKVSAPIKPKVLGSSVRIPTPAPSNRAKGISLTTAVFGGVVIATAIVAGAFYLQSQLSQGGTSDLLAEPQSITPNDITGATGPDVGSSAPSVANTEAGGEETAIGGAAVHLRVGPNLSAERRAEILKILAEGGMDDILVESISFPIAVSRVGYYHNGDLTAATELADKISVFLDAPTGPIPVRNYENLVPNAEEGRLDLWIKE